MGLMLKMELLYLKQFNKIEQFIKIIQLNKIKQFIKIKQLIKIINNLLSNIIIVTYQDPHLNIMNCMVSFK